MIRTNISAIVVKLLVSLLLAAVVIPPASWAQEPGHRISEDEAKKSIASKVNPAYPPMARQMGLSGKVAGDAYVDIAGGGEKEEVINGKALLSSAPGSAGGQWEFTPLPAHGKAIHAITRLTFRLSP